MKNPFPYPAHAPQVPNSIVHIPNPFRPHVHASSHYPLSQTVQLKYPYNKPIAIALYIFTVVGILFAIAQITLLGYRSYRSLKVVGAVACAISVVQWTLVLAYMGIAHFHIRKTVRQWNREFPSFASHGSSNDLFVTDATWNDVAVLDPANKNQNMQDTWAFRVQWHLGKSTHWMSPPIYPRYTITRAADTSVPRSVPFEEGRRSESVIDFEDDDGADIALSKFEDT